MHEFPDRHYCGNSGNHVVIAVARCLGSRITVPISVLITLSFLYFFGVELHTVSLAGLILVLGMIVDNSIVVIDNHVEKIDHQISPWHAAIKSAKELLTPIITATLAIMAAYIPLGLWFLVQQVNLCVRCQLSFQLH